MDREMQTVSALSRKFEVLQHLHNRPSWRAQKDQREANTRDAERDGSTEFNGPERPSPKASSTRKTITDQKEFYLKRLGVQAKYFQSKADKSDVAQQPQASGQAVAKPTPWGGVRDAQSHPKREPSCGSKATEVRDLDNPEDSKPSCHGSSQCAGDAKNSKPKDIEDFEIMCNDCFLLVRLSESFSCSGTAQGCKVALRARRDPEANKMDRPKDNAVADINFQLLKLRAALEMRLQDASPNLVNVMRHLTNLRVHVNTALRWSPGSHDLGAMSDHTVQQVKQLSTTSRVLAPAVYIFSKRIENLIVQKAYALQKKAKIEKKQLQYEPPARRSHGLNDSLRDVEMTTNTVVTVASEVAKRHQEDVMCQRTEVSQEQGEFDVANVQEASELISRCHAGEDEQRRWFFALCLKAKMSCTAVALKRKILMSDLYLKVKADKIPVENWDAWIREQLSTPIGGTAPSGEAQSKSAADALAAGGIAGLPTQPIGGYASMTTALEKPELEDTSMVPAPVPPGPSSDDASTAATGGFSMASPPTCSRDGADYDSIASATPPPIVRQPAGAWRN